MDFFNPTQHFFKRDTAVLFHLGLMFLHYVTYFECNFSNLSWKLEFDKYCVYKCFFRGIFNCRSPQAGIIKLEWWVEAIFWKNLEERSEFTLIEPLIWFSEKWQDNGEFISLPFCGWNSRTYWGILGEHRNLSEGVRCIRPTHASM